MNAQVNKGFAETEHRFPDWKPGDPLPEDKKDSAASESTPKP